jgi:hypothetical protein
MPLANTLCYCHNLFIDQAFQDAPQVSLRNAAFLCEQAIAGPGYPRLVVCVLRNRDKKSVLKCI